MESITSEDLERLAQIVDAEIADLLRSEKQAPFRDRLLAAALCQGAALHALDGRNGVKDFDVYVFFAELSGKNGPHTRRARSRDYGPSKFGRYSSDDPRRFSGRRIDIFWRTIPADGKVDPGNAIPAYLRGGKPESTPWHLSQKAVILLRPKSRLGEVICRPT
jgi:hypothetical protein